MFTLKILFIHFDDLYVWINQNQNFHNFRIEKISEHKIMLDDLTTKQLRESDLKKMYN